MNNIEAETIKKFSKLDPKNYKTLFPTKKLRKTLSHLVIALSYPKFTKENRDS